ncbi:MAG: hypothetical protein JRJ19_12040, partial [Deltaproteobacteria bacterium]|nr:hypothetical protein [Deltaproteobacteria bacterium]
HPSNRTVFEDENVYEKVCCWNPSNGNHGTGCDRNGPGNCSYRYYKDKTVPGGMEVFLKLEGCHQVCNPDQGCIEVPEDQRGRFSLTLEDNFNIEGVAATPAAYNTAMTKFITRVFVPTTDGRVFRISMNNGEYDESGDPGDMVSSYTAGDFDFGWDVDRLPNGTPVPWYDTGEGLPIMVSPGLALNYKSNLVLYFGTGRTDTLEWSDQNYKFYGVEETRDEDTGETENEGVDVYEPIVFD